MKQASLLRTFELLFMLCKNKLLEAWKSIVWSDTVILYIQNVCICNVTSCTGAGGTHAYAWHLLDSLAGDSSHNFSKIPLSSDRTFGSVQLHAAWGQALKFIVGFRWCSFWEATLSVQKSEFPLSAAFLTSLFFCFFLVISYTQTNSLCQ